MKMQLVVGGALLLELGMSGQAMEVHRWGLFEAALESTLPLPDRPEAPAATVEFTDPTGATQTRDAFWDGGQTWRIRFAPGVVGPWTWRSHCAADPSMDGVEGMFSCTAYVGNNRFYQHGPLQVSPDGRFLVHHDGTPFFWLADTAWNGALKSTTSDWRQYLEDRADKHFTGVQYVVTQWRAAFQDVEGQVAYSGFDPIRIHPEFFRRIDQRTQAVNDQGLLAVPVLLWTLGDREHNPGQLPSEQAIRLARYITARLGAWHVAWFLAGDGNYTGANAERWKQIGRAVFDQPGHALVTLHPQGMQWPWDAFADESWIDFLGYQSGHGDDDNTLRWMIEGPPASKWRQAPARPLINLEPPYEDHLAYQSRQPHTAAAVRRAVYWGLLSAPPAGTSYGAHGIWSWESAPAVPQDHGGSGMAKPWRQAMALPGSTSMMHLAELFTSIPWWTLRPDPTLLRDSGPAAVAPARTHLVYTRDRDGQSVLYEDGVRTAAGATAGDLSNWDRGFRLALANELSEDRPWLGTLHRIAIYDRALDAGEVVALHLAGPHGPPTNPLVSYDFEKGPPRTVRDTAGRGTPLDLTIAQPDAVSWLDGGGLQVRRPVLIASASAASPITDALTGARQLTLEAWVTPENRSQAGPARIVTLSHDTSRRNLTLGQEGAAYQVRCRTTTTSDNGIPALASAPPSGPANHVAAARSDTGDLAMVYCPVGGTIYIDHSRLRPDLRAEWFNPRSGQRSPAQASPDNLYPAPDPEDWVLLFRAP